MKVRKKIFNVIWIRKKNVETEILMKLDEKKC